MKMITIYNKVKAIGTVSVLLALLFISCPQFTLSASAQTNQPDTTRVFSQEHPLVYEDAWDLWPYSFLNENGEPVGFNIDLVKLIFKRLNIPYTIKLKPTVDALRDLKNGKSDLMLGMDAVFHNDYGRYGESVVQLFTHSVVHHKNHPSGITTLSDLSDHKVIVHTGSFSHHLMIEHGWGDNAIPYDDMQEAVQKAHLDPNSVIVWNTNSLKWLVRNYNLDNLEVTPVDIQHGEYKFMANNTKLLHDIDSVFVLLRSQDLIQPIQNKWFYPEFAATGIPTWIWRVAGILGIITLGILTYYIVYRLREKKTTKALRKSNTRLTQLLKISHIRIWTYHVDTQEVFTLDENGIPTASFSGYDYAENTTPEIFAKIREAIRRLIRQETEKEILDIQAKEKPSDRDMHDYTMILSVLRRDKNGKPSILMGTRIDVTEEKLRQQQVEENMLRYQSIFNSSMTDMVYYNEKGFITDMNQKALQAMPGGIQAIRDAKISVKDVLGFDDVSLEHFEPIYLTQIYKSEDDKRALNRFLKRNEMYYELQLIPVHDENQRLLGIYGTGRNVTELAKSYSIQQANILELQKANQEKELYINNIDYVLKNGGVKIVKYSPSTHMLYIYSEINKVQHKLTQTRGLSFVAEESKKDIQRALNSMDNLTSSSVNITIRTTIRRYGKDLYIHFAFIPEFDEKGNAINYIGLCRDVSEIKATELELERETQKAQELETVKNAFLHNMSYQIRTPLNTVVGFAELFEKEHDAEDEAVFIKEIKQSSAQLLHLINDILFLSRLDAKMIEIKKKPVDFANIFESRCQTCFFNLQQPEVTYEIINPYKHLIVDIDEQNLGIVIDKITSNAAQHTHSGYIRARYDYTGDTLVIAFQDTGKGISEEKLEHVFERFNSGYSQSSGLGLPICQEIVNQMGGKITIKSEVGKGTIVWVAIPCKVSEIERK